MKKETISKLAIFDVDGTLVDTNKIDGECFVRAFEIEFSIADIEMDWAQYENPTDSGITQAIFQKLHNRVPVESEPRRLKGRFISLLTQSYESQPDSFREIGGARRFFGYLSTNSDWRVAIATGGWHEPAVFKLQSAKFILNGIPISTSDDAVDRESIVVGCIEKARQHYGVNDFSRIVLIGDSSWDVKSARVLKLPFVGLGDWEVFRRLGVSHVLKDYSDPSQFLSFLESATVPGLPSQP